MKTDDLFPGRGRGSREGGKEWGGGMGRGGEGSREE